MATPSTTLNNGASMPLLGFGTWLAKKNVVGESVKKALEIGYRHIDCAQCYQNEGEIGEAFSSFFSTSNVKREEVFITSKLWVTDFTDVRAACELSLKNLQLEYLDLYLIHLPFEVNKDEFDIVNGAKGQGVIGYTPERIEVIWNEMEKLVKDGKTKAIGISNFTSLKVKNLLKCPLVVAPACNQVELHPYLPQNGLIENCQKENIVMVAYSPLGNPGFSGKDVPSLLNEPIVKSIAEKHKISPAQVLIAYGIERNTPVLVKSVNESRIKENFESLKVKLDTDDMISLNSITKRQRYLLQSWACKVDQEHEDLWDGEILA